MNTKDKYLKYKFKYLNLKKQIALKSQSGGEPPKNILIVTHNSRLRCLFSKLYNGENIPRFKNTAIIKLEIRPENADVIVSLVHEGHVNNPKKGYVVANPVAGSNDIYLRQVFPKALLNIDPKYNNKSYNIYLVRHGEGTHNIKNGVSEEEADEITEADDAKQPAISQEDIAKCNKEMDACEKGDKLCVKQPQTEIGADIIQKVDTELTKAGIQQANEAGLKIKDVVFYGIFVSDLVRTVQTLNGLRIPQIMNKSLKPYVLNCAHEIQYYKGSSKACDAHARNSRCWFAEGLRKIVAPENISICRHSKSRETNPRCLQPEHSIRDWTYYDKKAENYCSKPNSNMIERAISVMEDIFTTGILIS